MRQWIVGFDGTWHNCLKNGGRREDACKHREEEDDWVHGGEPDPVERVDVWLRHGYKCGMMRVMRLKVDTNDNDGANRLTYEVVGAVSPKRRYKRISAYSWRVWRHGPSWMFLDVCTRATISAFGRG